MKAPKIKKYAGGGPVTPYKTREEFDKYYANNPNYALMPNGSSGTMGGNASYYDKSKYNYDPSTGKWTALTPDASTTFGWGGVGNGPKPEHVYSYAPQNSISNATPGKAVVEDSGRKPVFNGNQYYQTYQYPDANGQYANATTKHFDIKTGQEIDPSKSFDPTGQYKAFPMAYKMGGIVKKLRGYDNGGNVYKYDENGNPVDAMGNIIQGVQGQQTLPNKGLPTNSGAAKAATEAGGLSASEIGAGVGIASQLAGLGSKYIAADAVNSNGTINSKEAAAGGALGGAAQGAQMGMALGPYGALAGGVLGAGLGGASKYYGAENINSGIEYGKTLAKNNQDYANQQNKIGLGLAQQLQARQEGYAKGGEIKGKGTAKSDSIKAKVKPGSFIVPAEHAEKAKILAKNILGHNSKKKADLNQSIGESVMLSNGEYLFSPSEANELRKAGIDLEKLAPLAEKAFNY